MTDFLPLCFESISNRRNDAVDMRMERHVLTP
jgi:hypothetical protein